MASTAPAASPLAAGRAGPEVALDVLELWVGDLRRTRELLERAFGFAPARSDGAVLNPGGGTSGGDGAVLRSGGVTVVLREGEAVARHVAAHGDTVGDVALTSADPQVVAARAAAHGLAAEPIPGGVRVDMTGDGTIRHSVRRRRLAPPGPAGAPSGPAMRGIDHVGCCLARGTLDRVAAAYRAVLGLGDVAVGAAARVGGAAGMRSAVLRSPGGFTVVLTEPAGARDGQTQRFLDAHGGPGVQHAALAYDDLPRAVAALRERGVRFLPAPEAYYARSRERLAGREVRWDALEPLDILVDADEDGLLFQLFTRPVADRGTVFFELIQRSGATGFGAGNVRALFAALEEANG